MNVIITLLTIFEVIVCLLLSLLVLMQRPRQEGLGAAFGSGVTDQMFGAQTTNVLQKATVYLGVALFALTFVLAICVSKQNAQKTNMTFVESGDKVAKPAPPPETPATGTVGTVVSEKVPTDAAKKEEGDKTAQPPPAPSENKPSDNKSAEGKPAAPSPAPAASTAPPPVTLPPPPAPPAPVPAK